MLTRLSFPKTVILFVMVWTLLALALPASIAAQRTSAFGPKQYTRFAGPPQTFTEPFEHCGTAPCQIVVVNGNEDGTKRISSASIFLNGRQIAGPRDFNQKVDKVVIPVALADQNQLSIRLASKPGSFLTVEVECAASPVILSTGGPGVNLLNSTMLLSALPIINTGTAEAQNVEVTAITLDGGSLSSPASLPLDLGTIPAEGSAVLNAAFSDTFVPLGSYALAVEGTYAVGDATYCFALENDLVVPPVAPGSALVNMISAQGAQISGAPFPPQPPSFEDEINGSLWAVPVAPFIPGTPTPNVTQTVPAPFGDPPAIVFEANNGLGINGNTIAEPSGASNGDGVVFVTANSYAAYSTDGGSNFTQLDPTAIFPADSVGFCCDQIVQYVPSIDRFIWLIQGTGFRLASASPEDIINSGGTAWTYWNLTPGVFGQPTGTGFDYPDLSVGNNYLYMSWNVGWPNCPAGCTSGHLIARTPLADIQAGGTIGIGYTNPSDSPMAWGGHLSQNTLDEVFWAGHNNNSNMRVFSLAENSNMYFWRDIGISSWATGGLSSTTPDGRDWLNKLSNFPSNAVIGLTRVGSQLWLAWSAGTDSNFQQPHIEMVTLDLNNNFSKTQQVQIWNDSYAFAYPALATNACTSEVGLSFEYGGNGNYENHVVGFWGDFVAYITTGSNVGTTRFGDYVTIRQEPPTEDNPGNLFSAFGYGINSVPPPGTGAQTDVHYVSFGRPASSCIIIK
jgi:hypothetical protein